MRKFLLAAFIGSTSLVSASVLSQTAPSAPKPALAAEAVRPLAASAVRGKGVYNLRGEDLGEVERVVLGAGDQVFGVVKFGEFLGLGGEARMVPLNRMALREDRIVLPGMTEAELKALPAWRAGLAGYRDAEPAFSVRFPVNVAAAGDPAAQGGAEGARIVVQRQAPTISVEQASPQVTVQQGQPEIIVRQPQPTVTVDIPQPEIIVRMPKPDVNVAVAKPEVQVLNAPPQVQVQPAQPNVQTQSPGQPTVRYERAEPRVVVNQAPQPQVRVERAGEVAPADRERVTRERIGIIAIPVPLPAAAPKRTVRVSELEEMQVYNARGERLGEIENMIMNPGDNKRYLVVEHGGFLGMFADKVALPLDRMVLQGNRLVVPGITEEEFDGLANWRTRLPNARPVDVTSTAELRVAA